MPFSPDEIANQEFLTSVRGYDKDEVRAFLRAVAADLAERGPAAAEHDIGPLLESARKVEEVQRAVTAQIEVASAGQNEQLGYVRQDISRLARAVEALVRSLQPDGMSTKSPANPAAEPLNGRAAVTTSVRSASAQAPPPPSPPVPPMSGRRGPLPDDTPRPGAPPDGTVVNVEAEDRVPGPPAVVELDDVGDRIEPPPEWEELFTEPRLDD